MNKTEDKDNYTGGNLIISHDLFLVKNYTLIYLYAIVFVWALVANILVILIVIKYQYMRSVTNYFLVNLSVADLLVTLLCMPASAYSAYTQIYYFGPIMCKASGYLLCISVASSIFTITAMAVDRYLAISLPFFNRCLNKKRTLIVITILWTISLIIFYPQLQIVSLSYYSDNITMCTNNFRKSILSRKTLGTIWFCFMFAIPGIIMIIAYSMMGRTLCTVPPPFEINEGITSSQQRNRVVRSRKRVAGILLLLAFVFAACWLPYNILLLLEDWDKIDSDSQFKKYKQYLLWLGHTNSALNPIIYCALSRKFRKSIKDLCFFRIKLRRRRQLMHVDSSGSGTQLHYLHRIKSVPAVQNQFYFGLSRQPSSQKTTKTAV